MRPVPQQPPYLFDNDCISSFLWVNRTDLLVALFPGQLVVPKRVVTELSYLKNTRSAWVYRSLETLIQSGDIEERDVNVGSPGGREFLQLTRRGYKGKILGSGEAAAVVLARYEGGTVASNNLTDVAQYCRDHGLGLISTDDILCLACNKNLITLDDAGTIWDAMKMRRRILPPYDFYEAYRRFLEDEPK